MTDELRMRSSGGSAVRQAIEDLNRRVTNLDGDTGIAVRIFKTLDEFREAVTRIETILSREWHTPSTCPGMAQLRDEIAAVRVWAEKVIGELKIDLAKSDTELSTVKTDVINIKVQLARYVGGGVVAGTVLGVVVSFLLQALIKYFFR